MQTTSWDDEMKLMDGIPYDIDFDQDFSSLCLNGQSITELPNSAIIEAIENFESAAMVSDDSHVPSVKEYQSSQKFRECLDKDSKRRKKADIKWKARKKMTLKQVVAYVDNFIKY